MYAPKTLIMWFFSSPSTPKFEFYLFLRQLIRCPNCGIPLFGVTQMDPGTILAAVTTSATVITLISRYYSGVKNAREDVKRFSTSVEEIHSVLQKVQALAKGPEAARLPASDPAVAAIEHSLREIKELEYQLNPKMGGKMMRRVGRRALKWPFTSKQMDEHITKLERRKALLSLALNADQT